MEGLAAIDYIRRCDDVLWTGLMGDMVVVGLGRMMMMRNQKPRSLTSRSRRSTTTTRRMKM